MRKGGHVSIELRLRLSAAAEMGEGGNPDGGAPPARLVALPGDRQELQRAIVVAEGETGRAEQALIIASCMDLSPTARIFWLGTGSGHVYVLCWALVFRCLPWIMMVSRLAGGDDHRNVVEANNVVSF